MLFIYLPMAIHLVLADFLMLNTLSFGLYSVWWTYKEGSNYIS
jgi:hypothetical protein